MPNDLGLPRHAFYLKWLKLSLRIGAAYDFVFAGIFLLAPELAERFIEVKPPEQSFYAWLIAVFLFMVGCFYLLAAYDPEAYRGNIDVAIVGRSLGFLALAAAAWGHPELWGLWIVACADLAFAVAHAVFWLPIRR